MSNLQVAVAPSAELQVAVSSAAPSIIPPKKQEQHVQQVQCLAPYATPPSVRISFLVRGAERVVEMPLPLPPNKFVEGIPLEPAQFMSTWQRVGADGGLQSQTVVSPEGGIVLETLDEKLTALGAPEPPILPRRLSPGLIRAPSFSAGMSKVEGLDPKPENRVFAAKFGNVPVMLRASPWLALLRAFVGCSVCRLQGRSRICRPARCS